jgi:septum formation protein
MLNQLLQPYKVILASGSPRRQQLLKELGVDFKILVKPIDETFPEELPATSVPTYLSEQKMAAFRDVNADNIIVITADTIVLLNDKIIGKPEDKQDAFEMLSQLSGSKHTVITGVTLKKADRIHSFSASTNVYFRSLSKEEIEFYISECQPFDKAGSYGIQEWIGYVGVEQIEGSFYNVMGLPTQQLYIELEKFIKDVTN